MRNTKSFCNNEITKCNNRTQVDSGQSNDRTQVDSLLTQVGSGQR